MPRGRTIVFLEGGYDLGAIGRVDRGDRRRAAGRGRPTARRASGGRAAAVRCHATPTCESSTSEAAILGPRVSAGSVASVVPARIQPMLDEVAPLAERFAAAGYRLYLVGGIVRDLLAGRDLGAAGGDIDLTTDAPPKETKSIVGPWADAVWTQGERFGTIGCSKDGRAVRDHHPPGRGLRTRQSQARGRASPPTSRRTSPAATSPSTPWRSR